MSSSRHPSDPGQPDHPHSRLSRLLDGDLEYDGADDACRRWRDDPQLRATWHRYHLIGDVMRSRELASPPERDARFLHRLRERLASEPPLLAPGPNLHAGHATPRTRQRWLAPAAVAAGFVAVAGMLVVSRPSAPGSQAPTTTLAAGSPASDALRRASTVGAAAAPRAAEVDAAMIRDAEIERYFRAHREMRVNPAAALPGGAPRNVEAIVMQR